MIDRSLAVVLAAGAALASGCPRAGSGPAAPLVAAARVEPTPAASADGTGRASATGAGCWAGVAVGGGHTCARKRDGTLWCWGFHDSGELGDGRHRNAPVQVATLGAVVADVATGSKHTCARKRDGTLWCWGSNEQGQLGDGTTTDRHKPVKVAKLATNLAEVAAVGGYTCARKGDGTLSCWGSNSYAGLGGPGKVVSSPLHMAAF